MKLSLFLVWIFVGVTLISCAHNDTKTDSRAPTGSNGAQKLSPFDGSPSTETSHVASADLKEIEDIIQKKDELRLRRLFWIASVSQSLVSSFDTKIADVKSGQEMDTFLGSQFYCKVMAARMEQEPLDDKLLHAFKVASISGSSRDWIYEQMDKFAQASTLNEVTMGQLARALADREIEVCGRPDCARQDLGQVRFRTDPFNDAAFANYAKQYRSEISKNSRIKPEDMRPGICFEGSRMPAQSSSGYDWKNRNWVGSLLPKGSFVVTYDDGPHQTYTEEIKSIWKNAGMAKPAFFWLTSMMRKYPEIARQTANQDYVIGSHSQRHGDLGNLARSSDYADWNKINRSIFANDCRGFKTYTDCKISILNYEIRESVSELANISGKKASYFRLPYGSGIKNDFIGQQFQYLNLDHFFWRVDSLDWQDKNPVSIRDRVLSQMNAVKNGIILFHDTHPQSVKASRLLVNYLKVSSKFRAVPLQSLNGLN